MADNKTPQTPSVIPPLPEVPDRLSVPAGTVLDENDLTMPEPPKEPATPEPPKESAKPATPAPEPPKEPATPEPPKESAKPATPAPEPPKEPAAPAEPKIKVGDKEYTPKELEKLLAERAQAKPPMPAPAPAAPTPEPPKPPTPEEIQAAEGKWLDKFAADEKLNLSPSDAEMETLLSGGKEAVELLGKKLTQAVSRAVLLARKSIYQDLNPTMSKIASDIAPLLSANQNLTAATAEQAFRQSFPEFDPHFDTVRQVAEALYMRFPKEMEAMTPQEAMAEVAAQTDRILQADFAKWEPGTAKSWKDAAKKTAAPVVLPVPLPTPAPGAPSPQPAPPAIKPPSSNSPAGTPNGGGVRNWHKETASSLTD